MAADSKIEWTDHTLLERIRASRAVAERNMVKRHPINRRVFDYSAGVSRPIPNVSIALGRITGSATGNDVMRLSVSAFRDRNNMIPCVCRCIAISAQTICALKNFLLRCHRKWLETALARHIVSDSFPSDGFVFSISVAGVGVLTRLAFTCAHILYRQPHFAAGTPSLPRLSSLSTFGYRWAWRFASFCAAWAANVTTSIEPTSVPNERIQGSIGAALAASFLTINPAFNETTVSRSDIFGGAHAL